MHVSIPFSKEFRHLVLSAFLAYRGTPHLLKHCACNAFKSFLLNLQITEFLEQNTKKETPGPPEDTRIQKKHAGARTKSKQTNIKKNK